MSMQEIWQNFRAWRRGERRVVPSGIRGRVYEQKSAPAAGPTMIDTKTTYKTLAKVIRADGSPDEHYNLTEDTKVSAGDFDTLKGGMNHG